VLFSQKEQLRKMNVVRSHRHEFFTEEINKVALSANDDKRIICEGKINTLSYGHYSELNKDVLCYARQFRHGR